MIPFAHLMQPINIIGTIIKKPLMYFSSWRTLLHVGHIDLGLSHRN